MYIVVGFKFFKSKKGSELLSLSVQYERKGYTGYKVLEVVAQKDAVVGDLQLGSIVDLGFGYNSTFCNSVIVRA